MTTVVQCVFIDLLFDFNNTLKHLCSRCTDNRLLSSARGNFLV